MATVGLKPLIPRGASHASASEVALMVRALSKGRVLVISGAGISTESGLQDYRSPGVAAARRRPPIQHNEFVSSPAVRQRYWARSFVGYPELNKARPNVAHRALSALHNHAPNFTFHIAQNVDGLLQKAGISAANFLELHGTVHRVRCLVCGTTEQRSSYQQRLASQNGEWLRLHCGGDAVYKAGIRTLQLDDAARRRADGDADVADASTRSFTVAACTTCATGSGKTPLVSPDLVFMGGSLPRETAARAREWANTCRGTVFVVGSTLMTHSAFSLVKRAKEGGATVVVANYGETRADGMVDVRSHALLSDVLPRVVRELLPDVVF